MESNVTEQLKKLSKDEQSFKQLKDIYSELEGEKQRYKRYLGLLESAIQNDYDSILITELELEKPGPRIVYVNDGFCKMTGYSKEEVIGKTPRILQGPKTDKAVLKRLKRCLLEGQSFFGQTVNYRKDGSEFINQWDIHPLTDETGKITHWVSYQHDITERKRAERQLVDFNVEFDGLREEAKRIVADIDVQGNIVMANKSFRELIGYGKNDLKKVKFWDLFPDKYKQVLQDRIAAGRPQKGEKLSTIKGTITHKSGSPIQIEVDTRLLDLKDQPLIRAEIRNITLRKKVMETLKERNRDFDRMFEQVSDFSYRIYPSGDNLLFESVSDSFYDITGLSVADAERKGVNEFVHPDDRKTVNQHYDKVMRGQSSTCEFRLKKANGEYVLVVDYARPVWDEDEQEVKAIRGMMNFQMHTDQA